MARTSKQKDQPPPEFIQEVAERVGRVIIAASQIEHTLGMVIGRLLKLSRLQHRSLVIPMSASNKANILRILGKDYLSRHDFKSLKKILEEAGDCAELRNSLAHGYYGAKDGEFVLLTFSGDARLGGRAIPWKPDDLRELHKRMHYANLDLWTIEAMFPKQMKLPKTHRPTSASARK